MPTQTPVASRTNIKYDTTKVNDREVGRDPDRAPEGIRSPHCAAVVPNRTSTAGSFGNDGV